jgi:hypothetical protein
MNYLTNYTLVAYTDESNIKIVWDDVCNLYEGLFKETNITNTKRWPKIDVQGYDAVRWYDHDIDMTKLSEKYPTVKFKLYGEGERQGDVWKKIFLGGKMKYLLAELVWPGEDSVEWV